MYKRQEGTNVKACNESGNDPMKNMFQKQNKNEG
jgi:hypothetical protein